MNSGIYRITNVLNNDFYIGSSKNIKQRFRQHIQQIKRSSAIIHRSIRKYGIENFKFEVIEECGTNNLLQREQFYLDILKPKYNIRKTTDAYYEYKHSEESIIKMIESKGDKEKILNIINDIKTPLTTGEICKKYNIHSGFLCYLVNGKKWKHLTNVITDEDREAFKQNNKIRAIQKDSVRKIRFKKDSEDYNKLIEMYNDNWSKEKIAKTLKCSINTIRPILKNLKF